MRHHYRCPLRWSDVDSYGHVNNVVFLRYLEEARVDLLFRLAREAAPDAFTSGAVVARHEIDYLRPLLHRHEPVGVELWVTKLGAASVTIGYEVKDAETVYAKALTVIVPYDLEEGRPRRLSAAERSFLEPYLDDSFRDPAPPAPR
ncbi:thioesterase family protein [Streptomyces sp. TRM 70351]|uniref:acyl-CoA thioesterase n=1 Tax=Streptomyces sp. TRM 70351 TaxID=3116552 RepID=UPI002E7B0FD8|nr:thioesterase family protein [Streptomyces sp. TRM 70351]MEE1928346.1 thioesterase family protein [Streptomyces sp. TRM 70351]